LVSFYEKSMTIFGIWEIKRLLKWKSRLKGYFTAKSSYLYLLLLRFVLKITFHFVNGSKVLSNSLNAKGWATIYLIKRSFYGALNLFVAKHFYRKCGFIKYLTFFVCLKVHYNKTCFIWLSTLKTMIKCKISLKHKRLLVTKWRLQKFV
jgi:hypothetical protein